MFNNTSETIIAKINSISCKTILAFIVFVLIDLGTFSKPNSGSIVLQLKWKHQFQFAGYYAALEKGFYAEQGLDVEIEETFTGSSPINEVLQGRAHYGIANAELIAYYLKGAPVVLLAPIFQHSPSVIIVKEDSDIFSPHDLVGKKLMLETDERGYEILSMLSSEGVDLNKVTIVDHSYTINDLLTNQVDALSAYISNEPYFLETFGIPFRLISPKTYGIDFYSDCLFTSVTEIKKHPERVRKFREASIKGWEYALNNKEEIANLIINRYNSPKTYQQLIYEANTIHKLINPSIVEIGHTNKWRWYAMAEFLSNQGFVETYTTIDSFFYTYSSYSSYYSILKVIIVVLIVIFVSIIVLIYLHKKSYLNFKSKSNQIKLQNEEIKALQNQVANLKNELNLAQEASKENLIDTSNFFAELIAELKTPILGLVGLINQILSPKITIEQKERLNEAVSETCNKIITFSKNIISISQNEENSATFHSVCITSLLNTYIQKLQNTSQLKSIEYRNNCIGIKKSFFALIDLDKIERALDILCRNAYKHTNDGYIEIGCKVNSTTLWLWVKDSGKGFNPERVNQLNNYFKNPIRVFSKSVGFSLTIVKSLIESMKGRISVESTENQETCFNLCIPIIPIDKLDSLPETLNLLEEFLTRNLIDKLKGKNILLYEKRYDNYQLVKSLLNGTGVNLLTCDDIERTKDICIGFSKLDIVIVNISELSVPMVNFISSIRKKETTLPIIAQVTVDTEQKEKYVKAGFSDVIQRPTPQLKLITKIIEYL